MYYIKLLKGRVEMPKQKTNEQFLEELAQRNPSIAPLTEYVGATEPITVKCLECGYQWDSTPHRLLRGSGCKKCTIRRVHDQQRKSNSQFISEVSKINPSIRLLSEYKGNKESVLIECLVCGEKREVRASLLLKGVGCNKCSLEKRVKKQTKTHDTFVKELKDKNPSIIVLGQYLNSSTKIAVQCSTCGNEWSAFPDSLLKGHGCQECAKKRISEKKAMAPNEYIKKLHDINPNIELLGTYSRSTDHIKVRCLVCGNEWEPNAKSLLSGRGCPDCAQESRSNKQRRSHQSFVEAVNAINPQIDILSQYVSSADTVNARCRVCGYEWNPISQVLLSGGGCPNCAGNLQKTQEQFVGEVERINPNIKVIGRYINAKTKVALKCMICGNEWEALAGNIRKGEGCPACEHAPTSFAEQFLLGTFRKWFGKKEVLSRNKEVISKELDIYIPKYQTAIEIGSWYWHEKRVWKDNEKRNACEKKGVRLIIIYDCFTGSSNLFNHDFYTFRRDLGSERGHKELKKLAYSLAHQLDNSIHPLSDTDWDEIIHNAYKNSRMSTTEVFRSRMASISPYIEIVGEYTRARDPIQCHCLSCGNYWENSPSHLLNGQGCPKCGTERRAANRRKAVINIETKERFESAELAAAKYNSTADSIRNCCRGDTMTCKGYHWKYDD